MLSNPHAREGAAMLPILYPDPAVRAAAAKRVRKASRQLLRSGIHHHANIGFFLHGLAEAMEGHDG